MSVQAVVPKKLYKRLSHIALISRASDNVTDMGIGISNQFHDLHEEVSKMIEKFDVLITDQCTWNVMCIKPKVFTIVIVNNSNALVRQPDKTVASVADALSVMLSKSHKKSKACIMGTTRLMLETQPIASTIITMTLPNIDKVHECAFDIVRMMERMNQYHMTSLRAEHEDVVKESLQLDRYEITRNTYRMPPKPPNPVVWHFVNSSVLR